MSQMLMLFNMQDNPQMKDMPNLTTNITFPMKIIMFLILPLNLVWCSFLTCVSLPYETNFFKNKQIHGALKSPKNASISVDIS